jgi:hypothetical protein
MTRRRRTRPAARTGGRRPGGWPVALLLALALAPLSGCGAPRAARAVTLEGEIIDPQCYFTHGGQGLSHRDCALMCARGGQSLAFLNRAGGRVYPIIAGRHGANPNDSLYAVVGYPVLVRGTLYEVRGQRALLVAHAERLSAAERP